MIKYVCGLLFDDVLQNVVLIEKLHPLPQKHKINGVGGKIEVNESAFDAMRREFKEEADVDIDDWKQFCFLHGNGYEITYFYSIKILDILNTIKTMTDEKVFVCSLEDVYDMPLMPNLRWIIQMALNTATNRDTATFNIERIK